jgi:NAD(P)-dependent dehydrogenase (short-subunit alcohol dehydrogenase family)
MPLPDSNLPLTTIFADRAILITGATGGIGRQLALACAAHGSDCGVA